MRRRSIRVFASLLGLSLPALLPSALRAAPSSTTLSSSPAHNILLGQTVTLTATVSPAAATGKVTFYDRTAIIGIGTLSGGHAVAHTTLLAPGDRILSALYNGDAAYAPSVSPAVSLTVSPRPAGAFVSQAGPFPAGSKPASIAVADFNRDGRPDLAIANMGSNNVTVLLGNASGGFSAAAGSPFPTDTFPDSIVSADFNGDGNADLAIANLVSGTMTVLLGNGAGGFIPAAGSPFAIGMEPVSVVVADFNGDGKADLAVANSVANNVAVVLGDGAGRFTPAPGSPFPAGNLPLSLAAADFNSDGKVDLVIADETDRSATVLLGDGSGGFSPAPASPLPAGVGPISVAVGDFNLDGNPDVAIASVDDQKITLLLGNGSGGFTPAAGSPFAAGGRPLFLSAGDINGDGKPDLAIVIGAGNDVVLLLGDGGGNLAPAFNSPFAVGSDPQWLVAADFNGDARLDLAVVNEDSGNVTLLLGQKPPPGDFDANGLPDVALQFLDGSIGVWRLAGSGRRLSIGSFAMTAGPSSGISSVDVADLNGDGVPDLVLQLSDGSVGVWYTSASGSMITGFAFLAGPMSDWSPMGLADLNGDGRLDLLIQNRDGSIGVWYLGGPLGNQIQGFAPISGPIDGWKLVGSADLNGDGHPDAIIQFTDGSVAVWFLGGPQGNRIQGFTTIAGPSTWSVAGIGDMDGDGHPDLLIRNDDGTLGVWYLGGAQGAQITGFTPVTTPGHTDWKEFGAH